MYVDSMTYIDSATQGTMYWIEERQVLVYSYWNYRLCECFRELISLPALELKQLSGFLFVVDFKLFKLHCLISGLDGLYFQDALALFSKRRFACFFSKRNISTNMSVLSRNTWINISPSVLEAPLLRPRPVGGPWGASTCRDVAC